MFEIILEKFKMLYSLGSDNKKKFKLSNSPKGKKVTIVSNTMFKTMFQNNNRIKYSCYLISFFVNMSYERLLKNIRLIKNEVNMKYIDDKNESCDYVADVNGALVNIEVNNNSELSTMERNIEYATKLYTHRVKRGPKYEYSQVLQININNFAFKGNEKIVDTYALQNNEGIKLTNKLVIINIYIPKLMEKVYNEGVESLTKLERYLYFLVIEDEEKAREISKGDKIMEEYMEEAMEVTGTRSFGVAYNKEIANQRQAKIDGYEEGLEEGRKEERINRSREIALSMIKDRMDADAISKYTGLSIEEIKKLSKK